MGPEDLEVMANAANTGFTPTMAPPIPTTDLGHLPEMSMDNNAPDISDLAGGPTPMAEMDAPQDIPTTGMEADLPQDMAGMPAMDSVSPLESMGGAPIDVMPGMDSMPSNDMPMEAVNDIPTNLAGMPEMDAVSAMEDLGGVNAMSGMDNLADLAGAPTMDGMSAFEPQGGIGVMPEMDIPQDAMDMASLAGAPSMVGNEMGGDFANAPVMNDGIPFLENVQDDVQLATVSQDTPEMYNDFMNSLQTSPSPSNEGVFGLKASIGAVTGMDSSHDMPDNNPFQYFNTPDPSIFNGGR